MKDYLNDFCGQFGFSTACTAHLQSCLDRIESDAEKRTTLEKLLNTYAGDRNVAYEVLEAEVRKIAGDLCLHEYSVWLLVLILMSKQLKEFYRQEGVDLSVWAESMLDLKIKADECEDVKHIYGTFVAWWFQGFFRMTRFAFGRLQFEQSEFDCDRFVCRDGTVLKKGDPVLAVHIPRMKMPLSKENCDASYRAAAKFFAKDFPGEKVVFTCHSWMLYPQNSVILHETSNTRRFCEDFERVFSWDDPIGLYPNAWRIFDMDPGEDLSLLPEDSFIRRAYKQYMLAGGVTGGAYGVKLLEK